MFRRIQIRETIKSHLEKEKELFDKGIKVLTLFFIDSVDKYRVYNDLGEEEKGEYAQMFEEEYQREINNHLDLFHQEYTDYVEETDKSKIHKMYAPYEAYLKRDDAEEVHSGYFSIDKKGKSIDPKVKRGQENSDDVSAYDLIMKDKERLLSFEEPTRFIFSHSALKEGWDNPNVFQICALKNVDGGSETRRRQEVGRGMRLCVDKQGVRQDFELIGEQVHEINKLTVIASESYEDFAKALQKEIVASLKDRPKKANVSYFVGKLLTNEKEQTLRIDETQAKELNQYLYKQEVLDLDDHITTKGRELIENREVKLPEKLQNFSQAVYTLLKSVYSGESLKPENERKQIAIRRNDNFSKKEFQELWSKISLKTIYEVKFDTEKLVQTAANRIDADLNIGDRSYELKVGEMDRIEEEKLKEGTNISATESQQLKIKSEDIYKNALYDLVGELDKKTNLKRATLVAILQKISPQKFVLFRKNPEEFIHKVALLINDEKAKLIINNITYHKTDKSYDAKTIFTNEQHIVRSNETLKKHIYDFLNSDSIIEKEFAKNLEEANEVIVYAKLPKSFYIQTPVARYSPDWAIVLDKELVKHIYFVAETKGDDLHADLRSVELLKTHCAKKHFETIGNKEVKYDVIPTFHKLLEIAELK